MLPSEPWDKSSPGGRSSPGREDARSTSTSQVSIDRLAILLSSHSGEPTKAELDRDIRLNQIVEQACLATGATGAAIALARGDEFICRASTGNTAPDLGMRLNIDQGLSAFCVHTGEVQRCDDSECDGRVDPEVCRHLGVRSVLVVPIVYLDFFLGIFEVFSPQPYAFYDRDIQTVIALSRNVLTTLGISAPALETASPEPDTPIEPPPLPESMFLANEETPAHLETWDVLPSERFVSRPVPSQPEEIKPPLSPAEEPPVPSEVSSSVPAEPSVAPADESYPQFKIVQKPPRDYWTGVLTFFVIALALLLGWMLGHGRIARKNAAQEELRAAVAAQQKSVSSADSSKTEAADETLELTLPAARAPKSGKPEPKASPDGLVVYQDGKIIFRQGVAPQRTKAAPNSSNSPSTSQAIELPPDVAGGYLTHRVEPHYPDRARLQNIQGPVVLQAVISEDGSVQQLKVLTGDSDLAVAAIDAVRHWRFKPYTPQGKPIQFATQITVNFALPRAPQANN